MRARTLLVLMTGLCWLLLLGAVRHGQPVAVPLLMLGCCGGLAWRLR